MPRSSAFGGTRPEETPLRVGGFLRYGAVRRGDRKPVSPEPACRITHIANTARGAARFVPLPTGTTLAHGRFTIEKVLAHGENGFAYLASHYPKGSRVVVKENVSKSTGYAEPAESLPCPRRTEQLVAKPRLWKEFDILTRLRSPHVAKALDGFMENGSAYLVMEHLTGTNLETRVETIGTLTLDESEQVARDLSDALSEVHAQGLLHLDIKPSNIMATASGRAVLVDFGEAQDYINEDPRDTVECFTREFAAVELFQVRAAKNGYVPSAARTPYGPAIGPFTDLYGLAARPRWLPNAHAPPMSTTRCFPLAWTGTCVSPFRRPWRCTVPIALGMSMHFACRANAKSVSGQCGGQDPGPVSDLPVMDNARYRPDSPDPRDFAFALISPADGNGLNSAGV